MTKKIRKRHFKNHIIGGQTTADVPQADFPGGEQQKPKEPIVAAEQTVPPEPGFQESTPTIMTVSPQTVAEVYKFNEMKSEMSPEVQNIPTIPENEAQLQILENATKKETNADKRKVMEKHLETAKLLMGKAKDVGNTVVTYSTSGVDAVKGLMEFQEFFTGVEMKNLAHAKAWWNGSYEEKFGKEKEKTEMKELKEMILKVNTKDGAEVVKAPPDQIKGIIESTLKTQEVKPAEIKPAQTLSTEQLAKLAPSKEQAPAGTIPLTNETEKKVINSFFGKFKAAAGMSTGVVSIGGVFGGSVAIFIAFIAIVLFGILYVAFHVIFAFLAVWLAWRRNKSRSLIKKLIHASLAANLSGVYVIYYYLTL